MIIPVSVYEVSNSIFIQQEDRQIILSKDQAIGVMALLPGGTLEDRYEGRKRYARLGAEGTK